MATRPPLVSVIIPTYNRWPMIVEAVQSVLAQTFEAFELIVVDDGSIDNTARRLSSSDSRLKIFSQPHAGVAAARNAGVAISLGKYIAFLDSDDLWSPAKLEIQADFMERNSGVHICQTQEIWIRGGVRVNPKARHRKPSGDIFRRSLELCLISPSAVMMTKELFYWVGGFDESFPVCEDYDLWLRIAARHPVFLIDTPLATKRGGHADQLSRSVWGMDRFRVLAIAKLLRLGLVGDRRQWALNSLRQKTSILAAGAAKRGKVDEARKFQALLAEFLEGAGDDRTSHSGLCFEQRISSTDKGALA
ncbi:MAG TPA: glycosyltransferase [Candidatus Binatia bacterium]|nr:glycosyltransferase [Candidatus Binatia bacterium]